MADKVGDAAAPRRNPNKAFADQERDSQPSGGLRLAHIKEAGSVLHVFSHIRKTYRVAWVVLEGGQGPPKLLSSQVTPWQPPKKTPTVARATKRRRATQASMPEEVIDVDADECGQATGEPPTRLRWVPLEQVRAAKYVDPTHSSVHLLILTTPIKYRHRCRENLGSCEDQVGGCLIDLDDRLHFCPLYLTLNLLISCLIYMMLLYHWLYIY